MTFANGSNFVLQIEDAPLAGTYTTVGCQRSTSNSNATEGIDVTSKCNMPHRTLINGGVKSNDISISGVYDNSAGMILFEAAESSGAITNFKLLNPDTGDERTGPYQISGYTKTGEHTDAVGFDATLVSAGAPTDVPLTPDP